MAKKIIGVENLNVIRDFVLSKIMTESDDIRRTLTEENAEYLHNKLLEASESLKTDYESKYEHLNNRIDTLKSEGVNTEELREIELQLDALNNNYADMQNGLSAIEDSIIDIENSVMSPGQLNELIDTALIERTTITEDMVSAPNVYTQNLVALIAKFGTVRALNIVGDEIEGKTISAYDKISGTDEPTWKLDRQGDGYLANKNISWDKDGNVTFGENVKIGWNDEWDEKIPDIPEGGLTESEVESMISTEISKYEVKAENIKGTTLEGKTIKSSDDAWKLDRQGDGYLAKGNISWDADGNVEFGPNVTIGWNDEWDEKIPDIPEGGLTETDVNNIISTKITKDYVESLEVRAKDIIGDTIQGKTIKSDDGAWEITKTGAGHLANNNISWDEDGNLNATISGTFDGGSDGSLAGGAITWDDSTVHIHKNFEFDNGVGISWNNISNTENVAYKTDIPDVGGYVTEDRVTEITDSKISTLEIDASMIKSGTIDTERLNVDNLAVRRLNTTGATTGKRIVIEGNTMSVYNSGGKVTCQLSNLSMGNLDIYDALQSSSNITINSTGTPSIGMYIPTISYGNSQRTLSGSAVQKTTIGVLQPGATLKIGGSFKLTGVKHSGANVTYQMNYEIRIYKDDVLIKTLTDSAGTSGISPTSSATISATVPETTYNITEAGTYAYESYITGWWMPTSISSTGDVYCETKTANVVGSCNTYSSDVKATSYIYEDGAIFKNMNGGFAINKDAVAMKCDNAQVVLKDGDIYMAFDGQSTPKKVVPRTYKFRLAGDTNQTMCVLTFGNVIDGE